MKIRMLVRGHTTQEYGLEYGKRILRAELKLGNTVMDDATNQLAKIEGLTEVSSVTVFPRVAGG